MNVTHNVKDGMGMGLSMNWYKMIAEYPPIDTMVDVWLEDVTYESDILPVCLPDELQGDQVPSHFRRVG